MKAIAGQILRILLLVIGGLLGAVVVGLLVYGSELFDLTSPGFAFVSFGFSGALIFAFYHVRKLSEAISAAVTISAVQLIAAIPYVGMPHGIIFSFGLNIPVIILAFVFERKLATRKYLKSLFVALTYGAMFVLLTYLVQVIRGVSVISPEMFRDNFRDGLLLGLGIGLGVQWVETILHSFEHPAAAR